MKSIPSLSGSLEEITGADHALKLRAIPAIAAILALPFFPLPSLAVLLIVAGDTFAEPANDAIDAKYPLAIAPGKERKAVAASFDAQKEMYQEIEKDEVATADPWAKQVRAVRREVAQEPETIPEPAPIRRPPRSFDWSLAPIEDFREYVATNAFPVTGMVTNPAEADRLAYEYCSNFENTGSQKALPYLLWYIFGITEENPRWGTAAHWGAGFLRDLKTAQKRRDNPPDYRLLATEIGEEEDSWNDDGEIPF